MVVVKERRVVLQLALVGLVHLILPLLLQFCNTLVVTVETHSLTLYHPLIILTHLY